MLKKNFINKSILFIVIFSTLVNFQKNSYSVETDEVLDNKKHEMLARKISKNIRCMVCQNESIDESSAPLAKDLRILIRNKVKNGNTEDEIYAFLRNRYGDFILLKPPLKVITYPLWFLPFIFFILGIFFIIWQNKKSKIDK